MLNKTPSDMRFLALSEQGIYPDEDQFAQVSPELLEEHYGVDGPSQRRDGQTGAGHPPDEDDDNDDNDDDCPSHNNLSAIIQTLFLPSKLSKYSGMHFKTLSQQALSQKQ
ncbi:hypothetical protein EWM64_g9313 [Hericium alpestre]|uniref:Uncharacterized protein n=1 Tax=Hericium alpestre TaxID=135208 RepID=A0A4Y9ZMN4_9AGAM|nr:hypothetical protein EWM64_g9313 [Hericium alpestre]